MYTIIKTRSASSIYPPLAVTAVANGTAWTVYGLAIKVGGGGELSLAAKRKGGRLAGA